MILGTNMRKKKKNINKKLKNWSKKKKIQKKIQVK